ncbi:MAG: hypothetical protein ACP5NW_00260 [Candidatus Woesearchaeota archaeon]
MSEENLLPNKTVAILIVVALLVTIIGTWTVLYTVNSINIQPIQQNTAAATNSDSGKFIFSIKNPTPPASIAGEITLNIA